MRWPAKFPVHPRLRGELATPSTRMLIFPGSSPLARGTLFSIVLMITKRRFIPACAGNSIRRWNCYSRSAVHPRLRGELTVYGLRRIWFYGSSPLARGTQCLTLTWHRYLRFIPACAGNSRYLRQSRWPHSVHPRLRGELMAITRSNLLVVGSSPLARGTRISGHC